MQNEKLKRLHLVYVVDTTGSMGSYCSSVGVTVEQIAVVTRLLTYVGCGGLDVSIISYKDYNDRNLMQVHWNEDQEETIVFAKGLHASGGGGDQQGDEAQKTALNEVLARLWAADGDANRDTIVLNYTDTPPHANLFGQEDKFMSQHAKQERDALKDKKPGFDWLDICRAYKAEGLQVFTFLPSRNSFQNVPYAQQFYALLGTTILLPDTQVDTITRVTMQVLLTLIGQKFDDTIMGENTSHAAVLQYESKQPDLAELKCEGDCGGWLDPRSCPKELVQIDGLNSDLIKCHSGWSQFDIQSLVSTFRQDERFRELVASCFERLFNAQNVLAITYNPVFGKLWRECCKLKEDERFIALADQLSVTVEQLSHYEDNKRAQLREFIEQSYNYLQENLERISKVPQERLSAEGYLILDAIPTSFLPTKKELRSITQFPTPGVLQAAQKILTHIIPTSKLPQVKEGDAVEDQKPYLPLGLPDQELFGMLVHLVYPGMWFTRYAASIMAVLTVRSGNSVLMDRAVQYLTRVKGQWLPPVEKLDVTSMQLIRLFLKAKQFLTPEEVDYFEAHYKVWRLRQAGPAKVEVIMPFTPHKQDIFPDVKRPCKTCKHHRSFTLLKDGKCGVCYYYESEYPGFSDYDQIEGEPSDVTNEQSHFRQCKTCLCAYAVVNVQLANGTPKCHYCRLQQEVPSVTCSSCTIKYMVPDGPESLPFPFTCPTCTVQPQRSRVQRNHTFKALVTENPQLAFTFGKCAEAFEHIFDVVSLYKLYQDEKLRETVFGLGTDGRVRQEGDTSQQQVASLFIKGKEVLNSRDVIENVLELVEKGNFFESCSLCFEDKTLLGLESACGQCDIKVCNACLQTWYGDVVPGSLVLLSRLLCPFCKRRPILSILKKYNKQACTIIGGKERIQMRGDMYYGWCQQCYQVKEALERSCTGDKIPVLKGFVCEECQVDEAINLADTKRCPGCKAPSIKVSGCNHVKCTQCGVDWCYICENSFDDVYEHIDLQHGGELIAY